MLEKIFKRILYFQLDHFVRKHKKVFEELKC